MRRVGRRAPNKPHSLRRRLLTVQLGVVFPLVLVAIISGLLMRTANASYDRSGHRVQATAEITGLQTALALMENELVDPAMFTGEPKASARVVATMADCSRRIAALDRTLPEHRPMIAAVKADWARLSDTIGQLRLTYPNVFDASALQPLLRAIVRVGGQLFSVVNDLAKLATANADALRRDLVAGHNRQRSQQWALIGSAVIAFAGAAASARWLHRSITRPLSSLREAARRVGEDDLSHRVVEGTTEELADVAHAFNSMTDRLLDSRAQLAGRERWFRSLVQSSSDVVAVTDVSGALRYATPSLHRVLGYSPDALADLTVSQVLHPDDADYVQVRFAAAATRGGLSDPITCRMRHQDGTWRQVDMTINSKLDDPAIDGIVLTIRDITESHQLQEQLIRQAFHDDLTGLANRALFTDRLSHSLSQRADATEEIAVILLDIDDFKRVNDTLGHSAGDQLLQHIAGHLRRLLREGTTVARLGGDEFAILLEHVDNDADAESVSQRLLAAIRRPVHVNGTEFFPRASVGVANGRPGTCSAEELLRRADTAMYQAKRFGKDTVAVYTEELAQHALRQLQLSGELRHAVERNQLEIYYQPTVRLDDQTVAGVEALLRWHHPDFGNISPVEFIPLAEESGAIVDVGRWVLTRACQQAARWQGRVNGPHTVSVNLSGRQVQHPGLLDDVRTALAASGLDPQRLILEITETVVLQETPELLKRLHALKALGIRLAIDDFGTGYNSLSYLQRLPVDILKLDRSFITGMSDPDGLALAATILSLAQTLQLQTVAEGVEVASQVDLLRQLRCDLAQGFLYARPQPANRLDETLLRLRQAHRTDGPEPKNTFLRPTNPDGEAPAA